MSLKNKPVESVKDLSSRKDRPSYWQKQINSVIESDEYRAYRFDCDKIKARYANRTFGRKSYKDVIGQTDYNSVTSGYNLLYANTKLVMAYLMPFVPTIQCDVAQRINANPVNNYAAKMVENASNYVKDTQNLDVVFGRVKLDAWLENMGQVWLRYEQDTEDRDETVIEYDELGNRVESVSKGTIITDERIAFDYVNPKDFLFGKAKIWDDVPWVARRLHKTKADFEKDFPGKDADNYIEKTDDGNKDKTIPVYEIWDKESHKIYFWAEKNTKANEEELLAIKENTNSYEFPCVRPLCFDTFNDTLYPTPINEQVWAQYTEIDALTTRINNVIEMLRVSGGYDAEMSEFAKLFDKQNENRLVPLTNLDKWVEKSGGLQNSYILFPVDKFAETLSSMMINRDKLRQNVQQTIHITDLLEGNTNPQEAYGTNKLKGAFGTMPIQEMQNTYAHWIEDVFELSTCMMSENFAMETIYRISGSEFDDTTPDEIKQQAAQQLLEKGIKGLLLTVAIEETRSAVDESYNVQLDSFFTTLTSELNIAMQAVMQAPAMAPVYKEMIMAKVRAHRIGRNFESAMETALDQAIQANLNTPKEQPQPTPDKAIEAQIKTQQIAADAQMKTAQLGEEQRHNQAVEAAKTQEIALKKQEIDMEYDLSLKKALGFNVGDANIG